MKAKERAGLDLISRQDVPSVDKKLSGTISSSSSSSKWLEDCDPDLYLHRSIGVCRSVFANKRGVPRQGQLAPSSRGLVELKKHMPHEILSGLEGFSHVWLVFVFSRNTNRAKRDAWARQGHNSEKEKHSSVTFPGKIRPPLLHGMSTGIFSTRTPHRPNPIGLTLAKVERVVAAERRLQVSGIDLCDETPILDIKPYVPGDIPAELHDSESFSTVRFASWTQTERSRSWKVGFSASASEKLLRLAGYKDSQFYRSANELTSAIADVLRLDVRSVAQGRGCAADSDAQEAQLVQHQCVVDSVQVFFVFDLDSFSILVIDALPYDAASQLGPL